MRKWKTTMTNGKKQLAYQESKIPLHLNVKTNGQVLNACMYCAFCTHYGCDFGAKSDALVTVIPTAKEHDNFELRTNSYVRRVLYDGNKANGVMYVDTRTGQEYEQPADVVV